MTCSLDRYFSLGGLVTRSNKGSHNMAATSNISRAINILPLVGSEAHSACPGVGPKDSFSLTSREMLH